MLMIHIQANNGDFFIEESQILEMSDITMEQNLTMINGELLKFYNFVVYTTQGPSTIIDTYETLHSIRNRVKKEVIKLWQSV